MSLKKCIVLDLDNTLWGGIVGEDGINGLQLSLSGAGAGFIAFQQVLLDLYNCGIILAINSRNNFEEAMKVIREHPNMILKERHFAAWRINWQDKALNLIELAQELHLGLDAFVFLDDDPINRAMVREALPEVDAPDLPVNPSAYAKFLLSLSYFPQASVTDEDKMRGNLYVTERLRLTAEKNFINREEFLKSLDLELQIFVNDKTAVARLTQLTEKTNQFNVNKQPLSESEVLELMSDPAYKIVHGRLTDRFGDHGIIILAIIDVSGRQWRFEQLLMSCRVIGRGVEEAFLSAIGRLAVEAEVETFGIAFVKTEKNQPAEKFVNDNFNNGLARTNSFLSPTWITIKYGKV